MSLRFVAFASLALALLAAPALARPEREPDLGQVLEDLERGIRALKVLGRHEQAREMAELADAVRKRRKHAHREGARDREVAAHRLEVMRIAMHALREAERREAVERMERCIHADELALRGRRDDEAVHAMKNAPGVGARIELLLLAADLWREFGHEKKAALCHGLAKELKKGRKREDRPAPRREHDERRRRAEEWIEVMRHAMKALVEAEERDRAHRLEHKIHSFELQLEGRKDEKAREVVETAPSLGETARILERAGDLWAEFGDERAAEFTHRVARDVAEHARRAEPERRDRRRIEVRERLEKLEANLREVMRAVDRMAGELRRLEKQIR